MKKQLTHFITVLLLVLWQQHSVAQCNISSFTATPVSGVCVQDGSIGVQVTGATSCSGASAVTATIRPVGAPSDTDFVILSATGTGTFSNLAPGSYEVRLSQGAASSGPTVVVLTSSYTPMSLTATGSNTSCSSTDALYSNNGAINMSVTGGTGPFTYTLSGAGSFTFGPTTATSHSFTGLAPGSYTATITDNSAACTSATSKSVTIAQTVTTPMSDYYSRFKPDRNNCGNLIWRYAVLNGNWAVMSQPGNATYTVNGVTRNMTINSDRVFDAFNVPQNTPITFTITDGCNTITKTVNSGTWNQNFLNVYLQAAYSNCITSLNILYNGHSSGTEFHFSEINTVTLYKEVPLGSNNWVVDQTASNQWTLSLFGGTNIFSITDLTTNYKLVASDACHSVERVINTATAPTYVNPLSLFVPRESTSILEGTSSINIGKNTGQYGNDALNFPIKATVVRTDGQSSMTITPSHPFSLGGSYTLNFPLTHNFQRLDQVSNDFNHYPYIGDLPLGEYQITLTDACGYSITKTITLSNPTTYAPVIKVNTGCANSDIIYDMNETLTPNYAQVVLLQNNAGVPGAVVRPASENPSNALNGQFSTVPPGEYFIEFRDINFRYVPTSPFYATANFSAALNQGIINRAYRVPVTIEPYQQVSFATTSLFCNNADANSGILSVTATGLPIGFITYSVWNATADPAVDAPLYTYNTTDVTETNHIFQNLSAGNYKVRVITQCGFTEQSITLTQGVVAYPPPVASHPTVCANNTATTLNIPLPESSFDIVWKDAGGTILGTGANLPVAPTVTTSYTVEYSSSATLGCASTTSGSNTITVTVVPLITQVGTETTSCAVNGNSYTMSATIEGAAPVVATGTGAPGTWVDNGNGSHTWTSDAIATGTNYYVKFEDVNACNTLLITDTAPVCCIYDVTCPTFAATTVQCYGDLPSATSLTEAQFEALGNADGLIGNVPCGVIVITASNSADAGTCPQTVTRTYTVTEYDDVNNNGVRDTGENTVLNTTTCTQTINVQDTTAPVVTGTIAPVTVQGCSAAAAPAAVTTVAALEGMGLTIADTCTPDTNLLVTSTDASSGTCPIVVTRTYTITDACLNFATATQTINIEDKTAPVVTGTITAVNAEGCAASAAPAAVTTVAALEGMGLTIADACTSDATLVVTSADTSAGTCPIVVTRTYTITDACGNFTTATQTINIQDTTAPVVTGTIAAANAEGCAASAAPAAVTTVAALEGMGLTIADACTSDATLVVTSSDTSAGTCPIVVTRTYTITDACGNFTTATQTINIQDTTAPVVTGTITPANAEGCTASAAPAAVTTVAALEGMGLTIADTCTPDTNLLVTSTDTSAGTCPIVVTRTYTITDACGNASTATQTINIQDTTAPVVTGTITAANAEGCTASVAPAAVTTVAALEGMGLTIADACTPDATLVVTSADTSAGTCPIVVTRTYTITDACGNFTTATQTINIQDTTAPVVTGTIVAANAEGCAASAAPAAVTTVAALEGMGLTIADTCTPDTNLLVTSTDTSAGTCPIVVTRTYTITDACGNFTTATQTINIEDKTAPVVTGTITAVNAEGCAASAAPAAVTTVAALEGMGLTIADACTSDATLVVTSADTSAGTCPIVVTRTYTITDACGNFTTATQTINIQDTTAPVVTGTIAAANAEGCAASAAPAAVTTVAALEGMGLTIADTCTPDTNLLVTSTDTSAGTCPIVVTRTYTITDTCGNFTTATQTINIQDTTAPVVTGTITAANVQGCSAAVAPAAVTTVAALEGMGLTIADACTPDANLTVSYTDASSGTCPIVVTRTYRITDACLNFATATQTITVQDTTAPVVTGTIAPVTVQGCSAAAAPAAVTTVSALEAMGLTIADACTTDANLTVSYTDASSGTCPIVVTRTYRITDACLNFATATQTITVQDTTAPVVTGTIAPVTVQGCSAAAAPAAVTTVSALEAMGLTIADACTTDANLTVSYTDASSGTCPIVVTRTYRITDACLNFATATQTINIQDTTAPVVTGTIAAANAQGCAASAAPAPVTTVVALEGMGLTIADACTPDATLVVTSADTSAGTCPIVVTRTYTITDACGNFTTATQTINVQDTTAPVITGTIASSNIEGCAATAAPAPVATVVALEVLFGISVIDACTPDSNLVVTSADTSAGTCPIVVTRTYTITDACGNASTINQLFNIQDTTAPVVTGTIVSANAEGCVASAAPAAVTTVAALEGMGLTIADACTPDATLVVTSADTSAGTCPIVVTRTYTITDACGNFTTATQTINVQDTTAPVFVEALPANATVECSAVPTAVVLTATDNCTTAQTVVYTETRTNGSCPNNYTLARVWTATDACGNVVSHTQTLTVQDTTAPVFVEALPANATVECSAVPTAVVLTATDNCTTAQTVVYTETRTNGSCPNNYTLARVWAATDACGNVVSHTQTLTVQDTTAPVFVEALPADATVECSAVPTAVVLTATDNCTTAQTVVYTETRTDGSCPNNYTLARVWTATDACGNVVSHTQTLTVQDTTAPVFVEALPADATVECSAVPTAVVLTATDNCTTAQTVVYTETRTDGSCPNNYTLARVWTATDACGNVVSHTQTLTVQDTTAPVFVEALPADATVECSVVPTAVVLTATDNCTTAQTVVYTETRTNGSCPNNYTLARVWTATDACGNVVSHTQTLTVQDTTAPVFVEALPADLVLECSDTIPAAATLTATDNCSTTMTVVFDEQRVDGSCANNYELIRTWTATDECGNETNHTQIIDVQDTTGPVFVEALPADAYANCDGIPVAPELTATDNCGTATVTYTETEVEGDCTNRYSLVREWTATDACGNQTTHTQTVYLACYVTVYNAVSPNGDGSNDVFLIEGIEYYPNNSIEVYNRYGVKVYETSGYDNINRVFKGYSEGRSTISSDQLLPTGTYFYILKYEYDLYGTNQQNIEKSGYLYIQSN